VIDEAHHDGYWAMPGTHSCTQVWLQQILQRQRLTPTATATAKATPTPKVTVKATPTKKPPVKKKKNPIKLLRRHLSGHHLDLKVMDDIYYRTPSVEVMMNVAAGNSTLAKAIAACKEFSCGRLQVASLIGCVYWEVDSKGNYTESRYCGLFLNDGNVAHTCKEISS
jgi:hypothetical protein